MFYCMNYNYNNNFLIILNYMDSCFNFIYNKLRIISYFLVYCYENKFFYKNIIMNYFAYRLCTFYYF